ncbi:hypothetical protein [Streptomyces sp. AM6-12]|uniref:hypothetical protein n=1 Tax=Streptomyces sp. AM6-12 TaxID=3345149 RepID=UPI00379E3A7A
MDVFVQAGHGLVRVQCAAGDEGGQTVQIGGGGQRDALGVARDDLAARLGVREQPGERAEGAVDRRDELGELSGRCLRVNISSSSSGCSTAKPR